VVGAAQLRALGFSRGAVQYRVARHRLHAGHRGVYAVGHAKLGRDGRAMAAVLACGPGAVIRHRSAAMLWGLLGGSQARWDITSPAMSGGRGGPSVVRLRRTRRLDGRDVTTLRGIPITTVPRTLLDVAADAPRLVAKAVHEAEVQRVLDVRAVHEAIARTPGRRGVGALRTALGPAGPEPDRGAFVDAYLRICADHAVPRPAVSVDVEVDGIVHEIDLLYADERLIVELDGEAVHRTRRRFHTDRRRDAAFTARGYQTVRYTWDRITTEQVRVADDVLRILALRPAR
jgi:hypothetical protein